MTESKSNGSTMDAADGGVRAQASDKGEPRNEVAESASENLETSDADASPNVEVDTGSAVEDRLKAIEALVESRIGRVLEMFQNRLAYDETKEKQFSRLNDELTKLRTDLSGRTIFPLVREMVQLHDYIGRLVSDLPKETGVTRCPRRDSLNYWRVYRKTWN